MNEKLGVLHALKLRWYHDRFRESENIQNVAVTQIVAGLLTFAIQVSQFLFIYLFHFFFFCLSFRPLFLSLLQPSNYYKISVAI